MFGTRTISTTGRQLRVSADGHPRWKAGGVTIDWSTVTPVNGDTTLPDGTVIKAGDSYIRYGTVLCRITASGKFGPYAAAANDGRQTLRRGDCYLVDQTFLRSGIHADERSVIEGGLVYLPRIIGAAGVTGNPVEADLLTAFPDLSLVRD